MSATNDRSWSKLVRAAFRRVTEKVLERAEQTGTPVIEWQNGKVVRVSPETIRERLQKRKDAARRERTRQRKTRAD